jgi:hypothetical protein
VQAISARRNFPQQVVVKLDGALRVKIVLCSHQGKNLQFGVTQWLVYNRQ